MMKEFVEDVKAGRQGSKGWPNTCYGMSKLGLIAYTKVSFFSFSDNIPPPDTTTYSRITDHGWNVKKTKNETVAKKTRR